MLKEMDLSQAVPRGTTAITFRYQIESQGDGATPLAWLADNPRGENPVLLTDRTGQITLRFRTSQKLYYHLGDPRLHLNLWIVEYNELKKHSC
ncbi:MAG: hypothetical protein V3R69_05560 [candidate division NC10 bacterium]|nr:hypothetical protein [candidate division NC10 bacterium]MCH7895677.1 hypothetical protein [candidate division NC10 bacterium]MCZ6549907.1 hypothetical protein [candidate division NC10 bacterium]